MFPRKASCICFIALCSLLSRASTNTPAEAVQWREDLHYLAQQAPQVHKNLFHSMTREEFESTVKNLDQRIPALSRNQTIVELTRLVAMIGDGHTYIDLQEPPTSFRHYPVRLYWFPDGLYVVSADKEYASIVGGRVVKLGRTSGQNAYQAVSNVVPHDNEFQLKWLTPFYMCLAEVLDGLSLATI